jgi:stress-induced-phosphoprotein 1
LSKGDSESAFEDAKKCVEIKPDWPKGYSRKGAALHALGKYDEAIATYDEGLKQDPNNESLKSGKEEVTKAKNAPAGGMGGMGGMQNPFGPDMFNKLALHPKYREYLNDPDFKEKLNKLQQDPNAFASMIGQDNRIMEVLSYLMGIPMNEGQGGGSDDASGAAGSSSGQQTQGSEKQESKKEEQKPQKQETPEERERKEKAEAKKNEGNQYYKKKEFEKALELYDEAMEIDPNNIRFRLNKASVYTEQKNYEKAIQECQDALEFGREHKAPFADRAKVRIRLTIGAKKTQYLSCGLNTGS